MPHFVDKEAKCVAARRQTSVIDCHFLGRLLSADGYYRPCCWAVVSRGPRRSVAYCGRPQILSTRIVRDCGANEMYAFMRLIRRLLTRAIGVRGNVEGLVSDHLLGWAYSSDKTQTNVAVGIYVNGTLLAQAPANIYRADLKAAGIGTGHYGFSIPITSLLLDLIDANGGQVDLCLIRRKPVRIGQWTFARCPNRHQTPCGTIAPISKDAPDLQKLIYADLYNLKHACNSTHVSSRLPQKLPQNRAKLFSSRDYLSPQKPLQSPMFCYAEFVRIKEKHDEAFQTKNAASTVGEFFKYYINDYSAQRGGLRVPLSCEALDYLNTQVDVDGRPTVLTRALCASLEDSPKGRIRTDDESLDSILYWWVQSRAPALHCEDCLVTGPMIARLCRPNSTFAGQYWSVSDFMIRLAQDTPAFSDLNLRTADGRRSLGCALLILSMSRPDYLRYFPAGLVDALLETSQGPSALEVFCADMGVAIVGLDKDRFAAVLHASNFNLERLEFATFTAEGHRLELAQLPETAQPDTPVDVQIIGPFKKTSGLGQATRLSAMMLEQSRFSVNKVDFGLNNPSPEQFSGTIETQGYRQAKINLLHLNAESIPLAFAYEPDVFSDAYNIGYVFWELDSPSECHYLGMDLLDEIWVSSQFGLRVFKPHSDVPVNNVGMSFDSLPNLDKAAARHFLRKTANISATDFTFLVTFDSYSFVQRKNPLGVLRAFQLAFPSEVPENKTVRLVIKTQNRTNIADPVQVEIWTQIDALVAADARIVLIDATLPYEDLLRLKTGADAYLSLHRAEGWGFGIIEAMNLGVPVVCTHYSGNEDFCWEDTCWPVKYTLRQLGPNDYIYVSKGQKWADPDCDDAAQQMRELRNNPDEASRRAAVAKAFVQDKFGQSVIAQRYRQRLDAIFADMDKTPNRFP